MGLRTSGADYNAPAAQGKRARGRHQAARTATSAWT
jgi:hypothetical protein